MEGWLVVFSAYFDASGDETDTRVKFVSVSGFVAHADIWIEWEKDWLECLKKRHILNEEGLPDFHCLIALITPIFLMDGEQENRNAKIFSVVGIINRHLGRRVSCVINVDEIRNIWMKTYAKTSVLRGPI